MSDSADYTPVPDDIKPAPPPPRDQQEREVLNTLVKVPASPLLVNKGHPAYMIVGEHGTYLVTVEKTSSAVFSTTQHDAAMGA